MPAESVFFVTPSRISWFGLPPSTNQRTTWPSGPFTSMWNQECGLIISHFTRVPSSFIGLFTSNSAEKAWCARSDADASTNPTPATTNARFVLIAVSPLRRPEGLRLPTTPLLRRFPCGRFRPLLVLEPRTGEGVLQPAVAFMTSVLEDWTDCLLHGQLGRPGSCPCRWIVDRKFVVDPVLGHAREAFGQAHVLTGPLKRRLVGEIRRLDDQGLAFPAANRVPRQASNVGRQMWTSIERDNARLMDHLNENHHVTRPLDDLIVVVIGARQHRRTGAVHENASHAQGLVLCGVGGAAHALPRFCPRRVPFLSFFGHRGELPIGRIEDE